MFILLPTCKLAAAVDFTIDTLYHQFTQKSISHTLAITMLYLTKICAKKSHATTVTVTGYFHNNLHQKNECTNIEDLVITSVAVGKESTTEGQRSRSWSLAYLTHKMHHNWRVISKVQRNAAPIMCAKNHAKIKAANSISGAKMPTL